MTNQDNGTTSKSLMNTLVDGLTTKPNLESEVKGSLWDRTGVFLDDLFLDTLGIQSVLGTNPISSVDWKTDFKDQKDVQNVSRDVLLMANYVFGLQTNPNFENSSSSYNAFNQVFASSNPESEAKLVGAIRTVNQYLLTGKDHDKISENIKIMNEVSKEIINQDKLKLPVVVEKDVYFSRAEKIYSALTQLEIAGADTYLTTGEHIQFNPIKSDEEFYSMEMVDRHDVLENELADLYVLMGEQIPNDKRKPEDSLIPDSAQIIIDSKLFLMYKGILDRNSATKKDIDEIVIDMPGVYRSIVSKAIKNPKLASPKIVDFAIQEGLSNYKVCPQIYAEEATKINATNMQILVNDDVGEFVDANQYYDEQQVVWTVPEEK